MTETVVTLDVRAEIRQGREPFSRIMAAVAKLAVGQSLRLIAPFEPAPLFRIMEQRGFAHQSSALASGDWEVVFSPGPATAVVAPERTETVPVADGSSGTVELDARGLEPPQPLVTILEALG